MSELGKRLLTAVLTIPLIIWILWVGSFPLIVVFLAVSVLGFWEYISMMKHIKVQIGKQWLPIAAMLYLALTLSRTYDMVIIWLVFISILISSLVLYSREKSVIPMLATHFGLIYTAMLPALIVRIGLDYRAKKILLALILMIWIVDSVAYFIGMRFGKHRNVTEISPKKSIEGFIAGALAPLVICVVYWFLPYRPIDVHVILLIAVAAGLVGQLGDLCESMLKRYCGVKDSSGIIPGHGGILDRVDSVLLAGSFLYCALILFG